MVVTYLERCVSMIHSHCVLLLFAAEKMSIKFVFHFLIWKRVMSHDNLWQIIFLSLSFNNTRLMIPGGKTPNGDHYVPLILQLLLKTSGKISSGDLNVK